MRGESARLMRMPSVDEAIILVGGLGTRLRSAVPELPKPIAPVAGRPFLAWLLDRLDQAGIRRAILSIGYRADLIRAAIGTHHRRMSVEFVEEHEPLGTGGALRRSLAGVRGDRAFALNGDTLFMVDLQLMDQTARQFPERLVVALRAIDVTDRYGTCTVENGQIISFAASSTQGPALINGGVYVLPRRLFDPFDLPEKFSFESAFMERYLRQLGPRAVISNGAFIDIGVPAFYEAAQTLVPSWLGR